MTGLCPLLDMDTQPHHMSFRHSLVDLLLKVLSLLSTVSNEQMLHLKQVCFVHVLYS